MTGHQCPHCAAPIAIATTPEGVTVLADSTQTHDTSGGNQMALNGDGIEQSLRSALGMNHTDQQPAPNPTEGPWL